MAQHIDLISWAESGGTLNGSVEELGVGATVSLTINFNGNSPYAPANNDYVILSNGGHAVYNSTSDLWVYTVPSDATQGDLSLGTASPLTFYLAAGGSTTVVTTGGVTLPSQPSTTYDVVCFFSGTLIATPDGEKAIEDLKAGDLVTTADGGTAPIIWLGRQTVASDFVDGLHVYPIRVLAGALADGVPARDLLISPCHALLVDNMLVQAAALVNNVSILRERDVPKSFTYYHVETANHELILAENTPAETFVDNVNRMGFDNWDEHSGEEAIAEMDLPRVKSARQLPRKTATRLLSRGEAMNNSKAAVAA